MLRLLMKASKRIFSFLSSLLCLLKLTLLLLAISNKLVLSLFDAILFNAGISGSIEVYILLLIADLLCKHRPLLIQSLPRLVNATNSLHFTFLMCFALHLLLHRLYVAR